MSDLEKLIRDNRKEWSSSEEGTIGGDVLALCDAAEKANAVVFAAIEVSDRWSAYDVRGSEMAALAAAVDKACAE